MICFQIQKQEDGSELICPVVICDTCGEQITNAEDGIVDGDLGWELGDTSGHLRTYHRGDCTPEKAIDTTWDRLDVVLDQLCLNSGLGHHPARKKPSATELMNGVTEIV